ncbi:PEP-CTERM sorting domain-containing protein [Algisphaera agarilytica]|uniref:Ice-binding protein C-terminal domain-containing protein n=1 Tax=Algisphaera agarilytica TaxID=1385975 RepID=A0A7X0LLT9_9BACT|nr:PEP-CTERM sorting domain-containing protein [Algisphaera agarilytica]MBB6431264.1 hypothetical protein [Algisphaera agarilytica]
MNLLSLSTRFVAAAAVATALSTSASAQIELTTNGDFETGDLTGWTQFETGPGQQSVTTSNPSAGTYAGNINNDVALSNSLWKQANIGIGQVAIGDKVTISFDARGSYAVPGGVAFAEFFQELSGGGTSGGGILGGAPLAISGDPEEWTTFTFDWTITGDVSGGVTLQLGATNGPAGGTNMFYDNVSVTVPEPASMALVGLGGLAMLARRRKA